MIPGGLILSLDTLLILRGLILSLDHRWKLGVVHDISRVDILGVLVMCRFLVQSRHMSLIMLCVACGLRPGLIREACLIRKACLELCSGIQGIGSLLKQLLYLSSRGTNRLAAIRALLDGAGRQRGIFQ